MLRQVVEFVINGIVLCFNLTKTFIMDKVGTVNITYYHFLIFVIFMTITVRLISFIKGIQEVENEEQKQAYNEWLKDHPSTPRRFKR